MALVRNNHNPNRGMEGDLESPPWNIGDCPATYKGFLCTLDAGHGPVHAAGARVFTVAVWLDFESD